MKDLQQTRAVAIATASLSSFGGALPRRACPATPRPMAQSDCWRVRHSGLAWVLSVLLLLTLCVAAQAQFLYSTSGSTITITGYTGSGGAVSIPSTINGQPVTTIGNLAFGFCTNLTDVTIPSSVTNIGSEAFYNSSITSVAIPSSVTGIGGAAFEGCTSLTSVTIPNSIASIASYTFDGCTGLTGVTIPANITSIGSAAFQACSSLTSTLFTGNAPSMGSGVFNSSGSGFTVFYFDGVTGFSSPTWDGYPVTDMGTPPPPAITIGPASGTTYQSGTLTGTVNPNGLATTVCLQYGTTTSYGSSTLPQPVGSGTVAALFSMTIAGLGAETTYHCQAIAINSSGTTYSLDQTFTTVNPPPTVLTGSATGTVFVSTNLNGTVNPNGLATTCYFQYGLDTTYGTATGIQTAGTNTTVASFSAAISGLLPGATYHFQIVAVNSSGTSYGADQTFMTPINCPTVATGTASAVTYQSAALSGTVTPNGQATTLYFQYGTTTAYGSVTSTQAAGSGTSAAQFTSAVSGLSAGTIYHFQLVAINSSGTSYGTDQTFTTPTGPLPIIVTEAVTGAFSYAATFAGTVNPNGVATTCYFRCWPVVSWGGGGGDTAGQPIGSGTSVVACSGSIGGLEDMYTEYYCQLVAVNANGSSYGPIQEFSTGPNGPSGETYAATNITANSATLNGYFMEGYFPAGAFFQYGLTASYGQQTGYVQMGYCSAPVTGLVPGTYHYRIVVEDAAIYQLYNVCFGSDVTFTIGWPIITTGSATGITATSATLNGTVNPNGLTTAYYFQYGLTASYGATTGTVAAGNGTAAVPATTGITGLPPATTYHFQLVAANSTGTNYGGDQTFTTTSQQPMVTTGTATGISFTTGTLNGTVNSNGLATTCYFQYGLDTTYGNTTTMQSVGNGTSATPFSVAITGLTQATTYHYQLVAVNSSGTSYGLDQTFTTLNPPPTVTTGTTVGTVYNATTLTGTVNPNGFATICSFQFGPTVAYGSTSGTQSVGSGTSAVSVSIPIAGLNPATTYHYQLVAAAGGQATYGSDQTFTTPGNPSPTVTTGTTVGTAYNATTACGQINPNGLNTTYYFQYGTSTAYGNATAPGAAGSGTVSFPIAEAITGLASTTTYHYQLVGVNSSGTSYGLDQTFTTSVQLPVMTVTPATSASLAAVSGGPFSPSSVVYTITNSGTGGLNWTASNVQPWLTLSATGGALATGSSTTVTAATNSSATLLSVGSYADTITFTNTVNGAGNASCAVALSVVLPPAPVISSAPNITGTFGCALSYAITATNNPASYNATGLPGGMTVNTATGIISGTPTSTGTFNATIFATNAGGTGSSSLVINVLPWQGWSWSNFVGSPGVWGTSDGTGSTALFNNPNAVAFDSSGNMFVADYYNATIRKVTPGGVVTTLAGSPWNPGYSDGSGSAVQFNGPWGIGVDGSGNLYVTDCGNNTIRKVTPAGVVTTLAGSPGNAGSSDGSGSAAHLNGPCGGAVDVNGNLYFSDYNNNTIRKMTPAGVVTTLAGSPGQVGTSDGSGSAARFYQPLGDAVDGNGNVYVADGSNTIRKITPAGVVTTLAGWPGRAGSSDGTGSGALFFVPDSLVLDRYGNLCVTDRNNDTIRKVTPAGVVTTLAGSPRVGGTNGGVGSAAQFYYPAGITFDANGHLFVADNDRIAEGVLLSIPGVPLVLMSPATGTTISAATLNGTVNPAGLSTTLYFQYGTTTAYGSTTTVQAAGSGTTALSFNAAIAGLSVETLYHYQLVAVNSSGTTYGVDQTFTTANPPPIVTTGIVTGVAYNGATLNGTVNPDGLSTTYYFQYGPTVAYGTTTTVQAADSGTTASTFGAAITGLSAATLYHYQIVAANSSGTTYGSDQTFTTPANPPPTVTTGTTVGTDTHSTTAYGQINPNGLNTIYYFRYGTSTAYGNTTASGAAGSGTVSFPIDLAITGLAFSTIYHYQLVGVNSNGTNYGADQTFTTTQALGSMPLTAQIALSGNNVQVSIPSIAGYSYQLQRSISLSSPSWQAVGSAQAGTNAVLVLVDGGGALLNSAFYRVQISQ